MRVKNLYPGIFRFKMYGIRLGLLMVVFVSTTDSVNAQLHYIIKTIAGTGDIGYSGDGGAAIFAKLHAPEAVAVDNTGNVYVADFGNNVIRKVNSAGLISTIAGTGTAGLSGMGGPAIDAELSHPEAVAIDKYGNIYIGDDGTGNLLKINGGIIDSYAAYAYGYAGDGGPVHSAVMTSAYALAVDDSANLYFSDFYNDVIRKVFATDSIIYTIAGDHASGGGYSGDGGLATSAQLKYSFGIAVDHLHNLYISDYYNNVIRKVSASTGIITTIAGTETAGYSGDGGLAINATLDGPTGIAVDNSGNVYISDNYIRIREILAADGKIYTIAGNGTSGLTGDGGPADSAGLTCFGLAIDTSGNLYIADQGNSAIRKLIPYSILFKAGTTQTLSTCENVSLSLDTFLSIASTAGGVTTTWSASGSPAHGTLMAAYSIAAYEGVIYPYGLSYVPDAGYTGADSFTVTATDGVHTAYTTIDVMVYPILTPAPITGADELCLSENTTLSDDSAGGTWYISNPHATITSSGLVTGISIGTDTVRYLISNSCSYSEAVKVITIDTIPYAATIVGDTNICPGALGTFVDAAGGGVWSTSNGHASVLGGYSFGVVSALTSGVDTLLYTVANSCGTAVASKTIVIDSLPAVAAITGVSSLCSGDSILLTDATAGGVWSAGNSNATVANGVVHGVAGGTDVIEYSITGGCGTTTASKIITIQPYAGSISGPATLCAEMPMAFSDAADFGVWSIADTSNATINAGGVLTGIAAGNDTVIYTITNSCGTASVNTPIHIIAAPEAGMITGDSTVCAGSAIILRDTVAGGHWKGTGDSAVVADGIVAGVVPGRDTITYAVTTTCGTATTSFIVTVLPESDCISFVPNLSNSAFKIYPDPSTGIFTVEVPGGNAVVSVIDIVGKVVAEQTISGNNATIDMSKLPLGDYIIKAVVNDIIYRGKIVINR